jgi:hypothetical protein
MPKPIDPYATLASISRMSISQYKKTTSSKSKANDDLSLALGRTTISNNYSWN